MEISASKIDCYLSCPLKWRFRYLDKIEPEETAAGLALGKSFHSTIKMMYRRLMEGERLSLEQLEAALREDWQIAQCTPIKWNGTGPEELEQQALMMLRAYVESVSDPVAPLAVEKTMRAPIVNLVTGEILPDVELVGILDRINADGTVVEFKTASKSWGQSDADRSLQMSVYSYLMAHETGRPSTDGLFEVAVRLKQPKIQRLPTVRGPKRHDQLFRTMTQVVRCIQDGIYYPRPGMFCPCEYGAECAAW